MSETKTQIIPHLGIRNSAEALGFYEKAFGAVKLSAIALDNGHILHAAMSIDGAVFFVSDEFPEHGGHSPQSLGGTPVTIHLNVPDCDAVYNKAVAAGCVVHMPIADMFWGDRYGVVVDPYGHRWSVATTIRQPDPEEVKNVLAAMSRRPE